LIENVGNPLYPEVGGAVVGAGVIVGAGVVVVDAFAVLFQNQL
jgi:hypothetical protein